MAAIALVGLVPAVADLVAAALRSEGHAVVRLPLDADVVRDLGRAPPARWSSTATPTPTPGPC